MTTESTAKQEATSGPGWDRLLYMVFFVVVFEIVKMIVLLVMVTQFVLAKIQGKPNDKMATFSDELSRYLGQLVRFQTLASEDKPYPFSPWPK